MILTSIRLQTVLPSMWLHSVNAWRSFKVRSYVSYGTRKDKASMKKYLCYFVLFSLELTAVSHLDSINITKENFNCCIFCVGALFCSELRDYLLFL